MPRAPRVLALSAAAVLLALSAPAEAVDPTPTPGATPSPTAAAAGGAAGAAATPEPVPSLFRHGVQPGPRFAPAPVTDGDAAFGAGLPSETDILSAKELASGAQLDVDNLGNKLDAIAEKLDASVAEDTTDYGSSSPFTTTLSLLGLPLLGGLALGWVVLASRRRRGQVGVTA